MRKSEREITEFEKIAETLGECDTVRIAFFDTEYPYIVPMSFGYEVKESKIVIYTHCAKEGKKHDLSKRNPKVCIEADILNGYKQIGKSVTADYKSIIGFGEVELANYDDCVHGIELIMEHCGFPGFNGKTCVALENMDVFKITLESVTGKKRF